MVVVDVVVGVLVGRCRCGSRGITCRWWCVIHCVDDGRFYTNRVRDLLVQDWWKAEDED